ncbi:MAG: glycosyltransferase family 2 protein [Oscillospiraceae bacterium]|nr:glycosyltransferase family 2 protein [Oscillospiraceae bacterium]
MDHLFTKEQDEITLQILTSLQTAYEATDILLNEIKNNKDWSQFDTLTSTLNQLITVIMDASEPYHKKYDFITLPITCRCMLHTLSKIISARSSDLKKCFGKLEFELVPAIEEAYQQFYFWTCVYSYPEREKEYYNQEIYELSSNKYTNASVKSGQFKYDLSIMVLAYNKLEYTKKCIEHLLPNIPKNLNCELILFDNGSTDGTAEYFESLNPTKLFQPKINWGYGLAVNRIIESKYLLYVSNDVLVMPGVIENMLECIKSDDKIARIVPATTNVSNRQAVIEGFKSFDDVYAYARKNNVPDPFRREERVRLCDPISLMDMSVYASEKGICNFGYYRDKVMSFPDDMASLMLRRRGYKQILQKDAFCYHFGSITVKNEIDPDFYTRGRKIFKKEFGVDPWGTGFCYDSPFEERVVKDEQGHVEVLGINCGFGSNSLKIKEQLKEYCNNLDCTLSNVTDDPSFISDLKGISDNAQLVTDIKSFEEFLDTHMYNYVVWQTPFIIRNDASAVFDLLLSHICPGGILFVKSNNSFLEYANKNNLSVLSLPEEWIKLEV